jgi:alternate signal-mediated exported protein
MNKMTKGALATGLGVALLVGGGGTLAVWNTTAEAKAGTIQSGDMTLKAGTGKWTNAQDKETPLALEKYRVVPGEVLTFTQPVTVGMEGDLLQATLTTAGLTSGNAKFLEVGPATLTKDGKSLPATLDQNSDGEYIATVTVTFPAKETTGLTNVNAVNDLGNLVFMLDQTPTVTE